MRVLGSRTRLLQRKLSIMLFSPRKQIVFQFQGDSGGPIVLPGAAGGTDVLVGIVSFSVNPCGLHPAFNVKVYNYLAWIVEARKNLLDASRIHF